MENCTVNKEIMILIYEFINQFNSKSSTLFLNKFQKLEEYKNDKVAKTSICLKDISFLIKKNNNDINKSVEELLNDLYIKTNRQNVKPYNISLWYDGNKNHIINLINVKSN